MLLQSSVTGICYDTFVCLFVCLSARPSFTLTDALCPTVSKDIVKCFTLIVIF